MRPTLATSLALALMAGACASTSTGPRSAEELAEAALAAVEARDSEAYLRLVVTTDDFARLCPALAARLGEAKMAEELRDVLEAARERLAACATFDWQRARRLDVEPPRISDEGLEGCPELLRYEAVTARYDVAGEPVEVRLNDQAGRPELGLFRFGHGPSCARRAATPFPMEALRAPKDDLPARLLVAEELRRLACATYQLDPVELALLDLVLEAVDLDAPPADPESPSDMAARIEAATREGAACLGARGEDRESPKVHD